MLLEDAENIKKQVRKFFDEGYKSPNKTYDTRICTDLAKAKKRNYSAKEAAKSRHNREKHKDYYNLAEILEKMPPAHRAGNCWEMSVLSAYYILNDKHIDRDLIYITAVHIPADHMFCLVWDEKIETKREFKSVLDFTSSKLAQSSIIVDPWLNVACRACRYLEQVDQKLEKWAREGKRIAWAPHPQYAGWHVPNGPYKEALIMHGSVALIPF